MTAAMATSTVHQHFVASIAAARQFFAVEAPRVADCCRRLADRFAAGGTLYVAGLGAQASDAHHVSVEFVHPILIGKRALPAVALTSDAGVLTARPGSSATAFAHLLNTLSRPHDVLLALSTDAMTSDMQAALAAARRHGVLTVLVTADSSSATLADLAFVIEQHNPLLVQEVTETLYHVIWELVHVFLDAIEPPTASFLAATAPASPAELDAQVIQSTLQKADDVAVLRQTVLDRCGSDIQAAAVELAARIRAGGRVFTFGNGGSATDAQDAAADAIAPPIAGWRPIPALALPNDVGVVTAIANDAGFEFVFARQIAAFAGPDDVALGFSTSGASRNIRAAMTEANSRKLLTIAMSGGQGGHSAQSPDVRYCFTAPSEHLPRIQEAHATTWHALLAATQEALR